MDPPRIPWPHEWARSPLGQVFAKPGYKKKTPACYTDAMMGLSVHFTPEKWPEVHRAAEQHVALGIPFCGSEIAYDVVRPFFEVDILKSLEHPLTDDNLLRVAKAIYHAASGHFTGTIEMAVLMSPQKLKNGKEFRGMHLVVLNRVVSMENLQQMIASAKQLALGVDADFIDDSVIRGCKSANLRMPGAMKMVKCDVCENHKDFVEQCRSCDRRGEVLSASVYKVTHLIRGDHVEEDPKNVRAYIVPTGYDIVESADFRIPEGYPRAKVIKRVRPDDKPHDSDDDRPIAPAFFDCEPLLKLVRGANPAYAEVNFGRPKVMRGANNVTHVTCVLVGAGGRYCMCKGEEHNSNNGYIHVSIGGRQPILYFKCFDRDCKEKFAAQKPSLVLGGDTVRAVLHAIGVNVGDDAPSDPSKKLRADLSRLLGPSAFNRFSI